MKKRRPFWDNVEKTPACWNWTGNIGKHGYGRHAGRLAHRMSFEEIVGAIPSGMQIDHLCRNRACVNPAHMEIVTAEENKRRGTSPAASNARKTHCIRGHEFTVENTCRRPDGRRYCRVCANDAKRDARALRTEDDRRRLREYQREWKKHHELTDEQRERHRQQSDEWNRAHPDYFKERYRRKKAALMIFVVFFFAAALHAQTCGKERWDVKTGTDQWAATVDMKPVDTTIARLRSLAPPPDLRSFHGRATGVEDQVWTVDATLTLFKSERDNDYHLVIRDHGKTMIAEIPDFNCAAGSPWVDQIAAVRAAFEQHFNNAQRKKNMHVHVRVTGVGLFDFIHGQTGVAIPSGIEIHPVLGIEFIP